ncbi:MAG: S41 family peptidase, partial [Rikenellaceae bacterium]
MSKFKRYMSCLTYTLLFAAAVVGGMIGGRLIERQSTREELTRFFGQMSLPQSDKISQTLALIKSKYVDEVEIDSLAEKVIPAMLKELDPHSVYIPASDMQRANEPLDGSFEGVGIVFNMATDTVIVLNVIRSGPSDKAGVNARDRIIKINDSLVAGRKIAQDKIVSQLRGKRGSKVRLSLERQGIDDLVEVEVTRDVIPLKSISTTFMLTPEIGFIHMSQFARTTHNELLSSISTLLSQGMTKLILDLRGNSGGFLDQAISISNEFLPANTLIVYTEDREGKQQREYSNGRGAIQDMELVILIDEGSASSSEILAGAIQDNDRGTIIGRRSYGKGLVQQQMPYNDGSAVRLTTARYYTPTGRSIQKPYEMGGGDKYEKEILSRFEHQEHFTADSINFVDSLKKVTPKGKVVYGGGGIMPDEFVAVDTTAMTQYFVEVTGRNILYRYTIEYSDRHKDELSSIATIEQLNSFF